MWRWSGIQNKRSIEREVQFNSTQSWVWRGGGGVPLRENRWRGNEQKGELSGGSVTSEAGVPVPVTRPSSSSFLTHSLMRLHTCQRHTFALSPMDNAGFKSNKCYFSWRDGKHKEKSKHERTRVLNKNNNTFLSFLLKALFRNFYTLSKDSVEKILLVASLALASQDCLMHFFFLAF